MNPATQPASWAPLMSATPRMAGRSADGAAGFGVDAEGGWVLQRRCALAPREFGLCFMALASVSLLVGLFFWALGAGFVMLFAGLEVLALGAAFAWHAVHAADGERLQVDRGQLRVDQQRGLRRTQAALDLHALRVVEAAAGALELKSSGVCVTVGRTVDAPRRRQVAAALRRLALN